jgi:L-threonine kinase
MASSTADIVAAVGATARALGKTLSAEEVARIALSVEPSDGTMFPGVAVFDHREGKVAEVLGSPLPVDILVLDFGGVVDTLEFNGGRHIQRLKEVEPQAKYALDLARQGIQEGDPALIGRAATISAMANQRVLFKPQLEAVMDIAQAVGALGVNVAHSGTVIGVLLDARGSTEKMSHGILERVSRDVSGLEKHYFLHLTGGGVKDVGPDG